MLRVLIIIFIVFYLLYLAWGLMFRVLGFNASQRQQRQQHYQNRKPQDGNVHIAFDPGEQQRTKKSSDFKGGDYVDYEEVK